MLNFLKSLTKFEHIFTHYRFILINCLFLLHENLLNFDLKDLLRIHQQLANHTMQHWGTIIDFNHVDVPLCCSENPPDCIGNLMST